MHATPACQNGDRNKGKDVPLHPWLLDIGDDGTRSGFTYKQAEKIISGIKEVIYTNGSHSVVELTKDQRELLEKTSIEL